LKDAVGRHGDRNESRSRERNPRKQGITARIVLRIIFLDPPSSAGKAARFSRYDSLNVKHIDELWLYAGVRRRYDRSEVGLPAYDAEVSRVGVIKRSLCLQGMNYLHIVDYK